VELFAKIVLKIKKIRNFVFGQIHGIVRLFVWFSVAKIRKFNDEKKQFNTCYVLNPTY